MPASSPTESTPNTPEPPLRPASSPSGSTRIRPLLKGRLALLSLLLVGAAAGAAISWPFLRPYVWDLYMGIEEIPLAGATVSYRDIGEGSPAVVIISGVAVPKTAYLDLQTRLARKTRVITYDRPGIGASSANAEPRTLEYFDKDLKALLQSLDVPPPYVLIGHSMGGFVIRYFADRHPEDLAGLVFLEAPHEDWFRYIRETWTEEESEAYFKFWTPENTSYSGSGLEEVLAFERNCESIRGVGVPWDMPVLMFTASNPGHFRKSAAGRAEDQKNWIAMQSVLLTGVKDKKQFINPELSHWPHWDRREWVAGEIGAFIDKLREKPGMNFNARSHSPADGTAAPIPSSP